MDACGVGAGPHMPLKLPGLTHLEGRAATRPEAASRARGRSAALAPEQGVDLVLVTLEDPHLGDLVPADPIHVRAPDHDVALRPLEPLAHEQGDALVAGQAVDQLELHFTLVGHLERVADVGDGGVATAVLAGPLRSAGDAEHD